MTFLEYINLVLNEVNEVPLTALQVPSARGFQQYVKNAVNRSYLDIVNTPEAKWPWLVNSDTAPAGQTLSGVKTIRTTIGTQWYPIPLDDPYKDLVDWVTIYLEDTEGNRVDVEGITWNEFQQYNTVRGEVNLQSEPIFAIQSADGRSIGIFPFNTREVYDIRYRLWNRPARFNNADDQIPIPDQFSNVLVDGAAHYAWRFRENIEQAQFSFQKFERGVKDMKRIYGNQASDRMRWK